MMGKQTHIPLNLLQAFVDGQLNDEQLADVLAHIFLCEQCLDIVDQLAQASPQIIPLDAKTASRIQENACQQIKAYSNKDHIKHTILQACSVLFQPISNRSSKTFPDTSTS